MLTPKITFPILLAGLMAAPVQAYQAGDNLLRFGLRTSDPDAEGQQLRGQELEMAADTMPAISIAYMVHDYVGVQVASSFPLQHNILLDDNASGSGNAGEVQVLSPNVTLQLHAPKLGDFNPWLGVGMHQSIFSKERFRQPNARNVGRGTRLELDSAFGLATQLGVDMDIGGDWYVNGSVSMLGLDTTATVRDPNGPNTKTDLELDPLQWQVGVAYRF